MRTATCIRNGFTLVEMTIYTGLTAVLMIGLIRSMLIILEHDQVTSSRATVQQELRVVMDQILYDIREAESVNAASSVFDSDTGTLSLAFSGSTRNPTVYTLSLGTIRVRKSTESWMDITGAGIVIDQLKFEKKTFSNTTAAIGVTITGTDVYGSDGLFTEKSVTLREVATIRKQFAAYDPRVMYGSGFYSSTPDVLFGLPPTIYENCTNGSDDDSDSLIDCADTVDCPTGMSCGGGQTCQAGSCGIDTTPPSISTLSPTDDATGISTSTNLVITFSEAVDPEAGVNNDIIIKKVSDGTTVETIDAQSAQVTGGGTATITVDPSVTLSNSTAYYVEIGSDTFDDAASNSFAGISGTTTWNFTTEAGGGGVCGDGNLDAGEQCDDLNTFNVDGCSSTCQFEGNICGNGEVERGERCDDGNLILGDGCDDTCNLECSSCTFTEYCYLDWVTGGFPFDPYFESWGHNGVCAFGTCQQFFNEGSTGTCTVEYGGSSCMNGLDDDGDGNTDCADLDCDGQACGVGQTCSFGSCL